MIHRLYLFFIMFFSMIGCSIQIDNKIEAPKKIRENAYQKAKKYIGMDYEWGGQDWWYGDEIDCSGLIVNVYKEAVRNTSFNLLFDDAGVVHFLNKYTVSVKNPKRGDVIFMGDEDITHIAILDKIKNGKVYFIDAYSKTGKVGYRYYNIDNHKIKSFGRLLIQM